MSRSTWKVYIPILENINIRAVKIYPELINKIVKVHNGKNYKTLTLSNKQVNFSIGELFLTKISAKYKNGK